MANSDSQVEVRIVGTLDGSVATSTGAAKAAIADLGATSARSGAEVAAAMEEVAAGTEVATHAMGRNRAVTESLVVFHEALQGRLSRIPGSMMILAQAATSAGTGMLLTGAAVVALAGGLAYLEYEALKAEKNLSDLTEGFALSGRGAMMNAQAVGYTLDFLSKLPGSTSTAANGFLHLAAIHADWSAQLINQTGQLMPAFIQAYGKDAPQAVGKLTEELSHLTVEGFQKLDREMLGLSPAEYETIENLIRIGDTAQATSRILADLSQNSGVYIKSLGDQVYDIEQKMANVRKTMHPNEATAMHDTQIGQLQTLAEQLKEIRKQETSGDTKARDSHYKDELDEASKLNTTLNARQGILQRIRQLSGDVAEADKRGDKRGSSQFSAALAVEDQKLADMDRQGNQKKFEDFSAMEDAKASAAKRGSTERIQAAQDEVTKAKALFGTESSEYAHAMEKLNTEKLSASEQGVRAANQGEKRGAEDAIADARDAAQKVMSNDKLSTDQKIAGTRAAWATILSGDKLNADQRAQVMRDEAHDITAIQDEGAKQAEQIARQSLQTDLAVTREGLQQKKALIGEQAAYGQISPGAKGAADAAAQIADIRAQIDEATKEASNSGFAAGTPGFQQYADRIKVLNAQLDTAIAEGAEKSAEQAKQSWVSIIGPVEGATNGLIQTMIGGHEKLSLAAAQAAAKIIESYVEARVKVEFDWLEGQAAMALGAQKWANESLLAWVATQLGITGAQQTTTAASTALSASSSAASIAAAKAQGAAEIPAYTGIAAIGAASAVAPIPVIGPALAVAAFSEMTGLGGAALGLASAEGGQWQVPFDDQLTFLHRNESVLPAAIAAPMRDFFEGGGKGGGDTHYHTHNWTIGADTSPDSIIRNPAKRRTFEKYVEGSMRNAVGGRG